MCSAAEVAVRHSSRAEDALLALDAAWSMMWNF
jgi:hypothetical protein